MCFIAAAVSSPVKRKDVFRGFATGFGGGNTHKKEHTHTHTKEHTHTHTHELGLYTGL